MKRLFSLILAACMLVGALVYIAPSGIAADDYILGDADKNGEVDMRDILTIRRYLAALIGEDEISIDAADVDKKHNDGDNRITLDDVIRLRRYFVGLDELDEEKPEKTNPVDSITIGGVNIKNFTIVIPKDEATGEPTPVMNYASSELKKYIGKACGVELNITDDESSVSGPMIKYVYDTENRYDLGKEGYKVEVETDGNLVITCGSLRAPNYATYFILEELVGWRFLTDDGMAEDNLNNTPITYLYEADNIDVPVGYQDTEIPVFDYRGVSQRGVDFANHLMLRNNDSSVTSGSTRAEWGWIVGTLFEHAHSYGNQCGIPGDKQPCLTSEETYRQIMDYNINLIEERESWGQHLGETWTQVSCSPNDNVNFCQCANCKAVYQLEGCIMGAVMRLSNRVAEATEALYPGIEIYTISYGDGGKPPRLTRPRENVCLSFCIGGCNNHTYDHPEDCTAAGGNPRTNAAWETHPENNSTNVVDLEYLNGWLELTNNIQLWYYSANFNFYMSPAANLFNVYNDMKYLAEVGVRGVYFEGCYGGDKCVNSFELLRGYMASKMIWDPFMSEEEYNRLFNEYLMIFYGDGWENMRRIIEIEDEISNDAGCWRNNFDRPWDIYNEESYAAHYEEIDSLFEAALAATSDPVQQRRIARCRAHSDFLGLSATYEESYVNGDGASRAVYEERYTRLYNTILDRPGTVPGAEGEIIYIFCSDGIDGTAGCYNFPSSADNIYNPMTWFMSDFDGHWNWNEAQHRWM